MMNLSKEMKQGTKTGKHKVHQIIVILSLLASMAVSALFSVPIPAYAAETMISIEKPEGWKQGDTTISISVDASALGDGVTITKIEARTGNDDGWQDVTEGKTISISGNQTVYVRVTDSEGNVYEQNRSIKCYDSEKPTLSASLTDGILTIQGSDSISGISAITVNGTVYSELDDGQLRVQLTQKDFTTKKITITATDGAGNVSDTYSLQNPYYEWAVKQSQQSGGDNMTTTTETGTETSVESPLPQDAEASEPTEAKGTVEDRTVTGIESELESTGETVESISSTATNGTKEFYTISTKSGKIFYLIVDNAKSQDNVYFLTEVSERDLLNFTLSDTVTLPDVDTVYAEVETEETIMTEEADTTEETENPEEVQMPEDENPIGSYLLIGLAALGVLGAGYYFKIYKPKHEYDEEEDEYEEEYEEERETEEDEVSNEEVLEDEDEE